MQDWNMRKMLVILMIKITWTMLESLTSDHNIFTLHLQTRMLTIQFLFTWNLLIWNGEKCVPIFLIKRSKNEKRGGRLFKSRTREMVLVTVNYWTSLGATGMVLANGYKMTLVKVVPHLPHRAHGDQGTGESILLKGEDNTAWFCSVQFFCELISFSQRWYICTLGGLLISQRVV
jgi:hypothetical protein